MSVRCTIDIEASNLDHLRGLLNPVVYAAPEPQFKTPQQGLERLSYELCFGLIDRHNKINCIKRLRELTGLGLKEAKDAVETFPAFVIPGGAL